MRMFIAIIFASAMASSALAAPISADQEKLAKQVTSTVHSLQIKQDWSVQVVKPGVYTRNGHMVSLYNGSVNVRVGKGHYGERLVIVIIPRSGRYDADAWTIKDGACQADKSLSWCGTTSPQVWEDLYSRAFSMARHYDSDL